MRKDRLKRLADFLQIVPEERFDMQRWVGDDFKGSPDLSCGTSACAVGWATTIPEFREAGLHLDFDPDDELAWIATPVYQGWEGYDAAAQFFEIPRGQAEHLFGSFHFDDKPSDVARRIFKMIEDEETRQIEEETATEADNLDP